MSRPIPTRSAVSPRAISFWPRRSTICTSGSSVVLPYDVAELDHVPDDGEALPLDLFRAGIRILGHLANQLAQGATPVEQTEELGHIGLERLEESAALEPERGGFWPPPGAGVIHQQLQPGWRSDLGNRLQHRFPGGMRGEEIAGGES